MINRLRRCNTGVPLGNADSIGFGVDKTSDVVVANYNATTGKKYLLARPAVTFKTFTASGSLTKADSGKKIVFNSATPIVLELPAAANAKGCEFEFVWRTLATSGVGHAVSPVAADSIGGGITALTQTVNKDIFSATATDALTDRLHLASDGVSNWDVLELTGTITKEA